MKNRITGRARWLLDLDREPTQVQRDRKSVQLKSRLERQKLVLRRDRALRS